MYYSEYTSMVMQQRNKNMGGFIMKLKQVLAYGMAAVISLSLLTGCGSGSQNAPEDKKAGVENAAGDPEEIVFAFHMGKTIDLTPIEDALNEILIPKINVKVNLEGYSWSNYDTQIGLMQSGGEQLDVFGMCPNFSTFLTNNQLMSMDGLIDEYAAETREIIGEDFLKSTSKGGSIYALPEYGGKADVNCFVLRKDLVDELNLPVDRLKEAKTFDEYVENMEVLTEIFEAVHEAHPELVIVPSSQNPASLRVTEIPFADRLGDGIGVLMPGDETKVVNMYATEEFKTLANYVYKWNQAGYILEDATTTQEAAQNYLKNGRAFAYFEPGRIEEKLTQNIKKTTGHEVFTTKLSEAMADTNKITNSAFGISVTSKHPEASMKFLNEMYTDPAVMNILSFGIEGVHWEKKDGGVIGYPEGVNADNSTYELGLDWYFGNDFLNETWQGNDPADKEADMENNKTLKVSPAMGFNFDSTSVSTELAAIANVTNQYLPGILCGSLDPESAIPKFLAALKGAGIDAVVAEKQAQLDSWRAENK